MAYTRTLADDQQITVPLVADVPASVLRAISIKTYAYASIVVTPLWHRPGTISDADLLALSCFTGVYLGQSDDGLNLEGAGLEWWLGGESDGGNCDFGVDGTTSTAAIATLVTEEVINRGNGITAGSLDAIATTRQFDTEAGTTARQYLDTFCAASYSAAREWRINNNGTLDVGQPADLFTTTPAVILTQDGGREGHVTGLRADLAVDSIDVEDYRTQIRVDWDDGTNDGVANNTPPSTWRNFAGSTPVLRSIIDHQPKKQFRERPKWNLRQNANAYAAYSLRTQTQANNLAARAAATANSYDLELTARIDDYHPTRFFEPGDSVWVYDLDLDLVDTANAVVHRGSVMHPVSVRVQRMTCPITEGMGVYLRRWTGAAFELYDLTEYVDWEDGEAVVELGTRRRFSPNNPRPKRINKRATKRAARDIFKLRKYLQAQRR